MSTCNTDPRSSDRRIPTSGSSRSRRRRLARAAAAALCALVVAGASAPAAADEYDDSHSGHPLRILAYVAHPFGVILDYLIFRPAHWIGSHEPMKTLFGHD